ncbi:MAG: glycosyltransferase [Candidatus Solibacter usitatus]|nr:glycosyltransferase [Candidatus Solibacter usitatus]
MRTFLRLLRGLPLIVVAPFLLCISFLAIAFADLLYFLAGRRRLPGDTRARTTSASVVIPNWNGRDLLEKYLPSVIAAMTGNPGNEIIVVDNGSTDGSVQYLHQSFPQVKVLALPKNLGFGGGSNAGFQAASNDIVVLLNSDMRVSPDFLGPLLDGFHDEKVFAVACQILFTDPAKPREESGLTQVWWDRGRIGVRHRIDDEIHELFPCFYPGGGSSAFDRRKFLELGGFDHLLRPFYLEDTDLGMQAWKRGWKVYYQPRSLVWHEHRGTIGKTFSREYIDSIIQKNFLLFLWKNTHSPQRIFSHFMRTAADAIITWIAGPSPERTSLGAILRAFPQLPAALQARWKARSLAVVSDEEAFRRPLGGYFHDRFGVADTSAGLNVLFLSPYGIYPPVHGGALFMYGTTKALAARCRLHLVAVLDEDWQVEQHQPLTNLCASHDFLVRLPNKTFTFGALQPHAVSEFAHADLDWILHRQIYLNKVDVLQIDYTNMGQYAGDYNRIVTALFEHDIYFQSIGRGLQQRGPVFRKMSAGFEYLRALRFEMRTLPKMDLIQTCTEENSAYLFSFLPQLRDRTDATLRAGIDTTPYRKYTGHREPLTMLFVGSFRHVPNAEALTWFVKHVLPRVTAREDAARLVIIGSDPPPRHSLPIADRHIEIRGFVEDLHEPFSRYAVFVCPILSGSGVRVKLIEAFCTGIPVVSTRIGAEGLATKDGEICRLADDPNQFAEQILEIFAKPEESIAMAERAYEFSTTHRDIAKMTDRLVESYHTALAKKRKSALAGLP